MKNPRYTRGSNQYVRVGRDSVALRLRRQTGVDRAALADLLLVAQPAPTIPLTPEQQQFEQQKHQRRVLVAERPAISTDPHQAALSFLAS